MLRRLFATLLIAVICSSFLFVAGAQDDTAMSTTLEELTSTSADYYGETVTLEGVVIDYVNSSSFVLGEDVAIDDDRVLVINMTGHSFPPELFEGESATVTGIVHASLEAHDDMMMDDDADMEVTEEPMMEVTEDPMMDDMEMTSDVLGLYLGGHYPEDFDNFTVIEVTNIEDVRILLTTNE